MSSNNWLLLLLFVSLAILGPWLVIWSLNTLFPVLAIDFNLKTWFATVVLCSVIGARVYKKND